MKQVSKNTYSPGTFLFKLFGDMEANGMFPSQAAAVMDLFIEDQRTSSMSSRWYDDPSGYPDMIYHLQWRLLCTYALAYIDANCPKAWFRPVFLPPAEQEEWLKNFGAKDLIVDLKGFQNGC